MCIFVVIYLRTFRSFSFEKVRVRGWESRTEADLEVLWEEEDAQMKKCFVEAVAYFFYAIVRLTLGFLWASATPTSNVTRNLSISLFTFVSFAI